MIISQELHRRQQFGNRDALLQRVMEFLQPGGHLSLRAPVDDGHDATEPTRGPGGIHRGVSAADHEHLLAICLGQRGGEVSPAPLHQIDPGEEFVGRHHVQQVLAGDVHEPRESGAGADEDVGKPGVSQILQGGSLTDDEVEDKLSAQGSDPCHHVVNEVVG